MRVKELFRSVTAAITIPLPAMVAFYGPVTGRAKHEYFVTHSFVIHLTWLLIIEEVRLTGDRCCIETKDSCKELYDK